MSKPHMINASNLQFGQMMVSAMRYALGRMSYVVTTTCDYIRPLIPYLETSILYIMEKDIEEHKKNHDLGMVCDKQEWLELWNDIKHEIARRNSANDNE